MSGPSIQNFSVPAGDGFVVNFTVTSDDEDATLAGAAILWQAFTQEHGVPIPDEDPVISKSVDDGIVLVGEPTDLTFKLTLDEDDTISLLRNYYHEVTITYAGGKRATPTVGILTVTQTENRSDLST